MSTSSIQVPFVDLSTQFELLRGELLPRMEHVMKRAAFILGEEVEEFEQVFATFCGCVECVGVSSGCDALLWAMKSLGIGPGDEVITVANTYIATVLAIKMAGATPVLVDCLVDTWEIDPQAVERALTPCTKAILPVHLYGQPADMNALRKIVQGKSIYLVEDAAQAHGAIYQGEKCGSMGALGCFSFYPGKNLGAYGDGGAVVTKNAEWADYIRMMRNYGQRKKYHHELAGWNSRLDTLQAAVLLIKMRHLDKWNTARRRIAQQYHESLKGYPVRFQSADEGVVPVYHLMAVMTARRDDLLAHMNRWGVQCGIHYPIPVHLQKACEDLALPEGSFPVSEELARQELSLPMYPELNDQQVAHICQSVKAFFED